MAPFDRSIPRPVDQAIERVEREQRPWWASYAIPVEVHFEAAAVPRAIAHQLGAVPDGYEVVMRTSGLVAVQLDKWTSTIAYLQAGAANTRAILIFYTLREGALRV